jgi:hypothetical protein
MKGGLLMLTIGANGEHIAYGIKHYNLDTEDDLINLPISNEYMGCTCFVISTSKYYMLNSKHEWIQISPFGAVNQNGSGSGGGSTNPDTPSDDIIYEGGII